MASLIKSLSYKPAELAFGTSGLRGLVTDMTDLECYINIYGFLKFSGIKPGDVVFVAGDLRESTPRIAAVAVQAIEDNGGRAEFFGFIPTPTLALHAQSQNAPCIMVTGSHIPADRNGIKFYKRNGEVLKEDEASIQAAVAATRQSFYETELTESGFKVDGSLSTLPSLPAVDSSAQEAYLSRYAFDKQPLADKHIIVYQHSAVGRDLLVELLRQLGAQVTPVGRSDEFVPIDTENVTPENKAYFKSLSQQYPDSFAIVSTDGDSDRPFLIDEQGTFYRGDVVGALVAKALGATFAATPISSNDAVDVFLKDQGIESVHTKIGSPYVITAMAASQATTKVGWEVNGGFLLGTAVSYRGLQMSELPTRDAFLPILVILLAAIDKGQSVSEFFEQLPPRYTGGGLIDVTADAVTAFRQLMINKPEADTLVDSEIKDVNLGPRTELDITDGIRIRFESNDVIHIRPSGNAPQLRVYTNSDSQERADELAASAVKDGGFLERFIAAAEQ